MSENTVIWPINLQIYKEADPIDANLSPNEKEPIWQTFYPFWAPVCPWLLHWTLIILLKASLHKNWHNYLHLLSITSSPTPLDVGCDTSGPCKAGNYWISNAWVISKNLKNGGYSLEDRSFL